MALPTGETTIERRARENDTAKRLIARFTADLVGDSVMLDTGTTASILAYELLRKRSLTLRMRGEWPKAVSYLAKFNHAALVKVCGCFDVTLPITGQLPTSTTTAALTRSGVELSVPQAVQWRSRTPTQAMTTCALRRW